MADDKELCGDTKLDFKKMYEAVSYMCSREEMEDVCREKITDLMWYADNLSYRQYGHSITGLAYEYTDGRVQPAGYLLMDELKGISTEKKDKYTYLTEDDIEVLYQVVEELGNKSASETHERLMAETALKETSEGEIISYKFADELSIQ